MGLGTPTFQRDGPLGSRKSILLLVGTAGVWQVDLPGSGFEILEKQADNGFVNVWQ